jgi:transposase-like protein
MNLALAEMYVQGVSTRKVIEVLQKLVGPEVSISSTQISRCTALLDTGLHAWRTRPLEETPYVILDARYERVREAGRVVDCAVLVAIGVTASGHRRVLGVSVALSEAEVHWRAFRGPLVFSAISDGSQTQHWRGGGVGRSLISLAFLFTSKTSIVTVH